jgi:PKD repeat protein
VYDRPGTYTITLTVTDEAGRTSVATQQVTVAADTRRAVYVSASGNDANDGSSQSAAVRTFARAAKLMGDGNDVKVLFRRGDTFDAAQTISVTGRNVAFGDYGDTADAKPVLRRVRSSTGGGGPVLNTWKTATNVTVQNLAFDSMWSAPTTGQAPKIEADGIVVGGTNVAVRGCTFLNLTDAINANQKPTGLYVADSTAPLTTGIRGYFVWGEGTDVVIVGNRAANSTREHNIRTSGVSRMLIAKNDMENQERSDVDPSDTHKGSIEVHRGDHAYVWANTTEGGCVRVGPRGGTYEPGNTTSHEWAVFDGNRVTGSAIDVRPGSHHVMIRDNVIRRDEQAIMLYRPDAEGRTSSDITITRNTATLTGTQGRFLFVDGRVDGITLTDNLYYAPNMQTSFFGTPVYVATGNMGHFRLIDGNVWPAPTGAANGGVMLVGTTYLTESAWDNSAAVGDDLFTDASAPTGETYSLTFNGHAVGSTLRRAA